MSPEPAKIGDESNWQSVVGRWLPLSAVLLKTDGSLWGWGTNSWYDWHEGWPLHWPGLRAFKPHRLGANSDWTQIFSLGHIFYATKADGTVWTIAGSGLVPATNLDSTFSQTKWRSLVLIPECGFGVRDDGTLWVYDAMWIGNSHLIGHEMVQVGREMDWEATAAGFQRLVALKSDGSLWKWDALRTVPSNGSRWQSPSVIANTTPTRLGIHSDWVAVAKDWEGMISLAADGSLWYWPDERYFEDSSLLKISGRPQFLANIFAPVK